MTISALQVKLVKIAQRQIGLEDDDYHAMLRAEAGVESAKALDNRGLNKILKRFERLGWHNTSPRHRGYRKPQPDALVTPAQQGMIAGLTRELGWDDDPRRIAGFAQKVIKLAWPQTRAQASKVITGLKAMIRKRGQGSGLQQQQEKDHGPIG